MPIVHRDIPAPLKPRERFPYIDMSAEVRPDFSRDLNLYIAEQTMLKLTSHLLILPFSNLSTPCCPTATIFVIWQMLSLLRWWWWHSPLSSLSLVSLCTLFRQFLHFPEAFLGTGSSVIVQCNIDFRPANTSGQLQVIRLGLGSLCPHSNSCCSS